MRRRSGTVGGLEKMLRACRTNAQFGHGPRGSSQVWPCPASSSVRKKRSARTDIPGFATWFREPPNRSQWRQAEGKATRRPDRRDDQTKKPGRKVEEREIGADGQQQQQGKGEASGAGAREKGSIFTNQGAAPPRFEKQAVRGTEALGH